MHAKIHKATVTEANLNYVGSITIDEDLLDAAGLWENEKVLVVSNTTGARLETYTLRGERGSGCICVNGAAAHLINEGEEIIIIAFMATDKPIKPKAILVDKNNRIICDMTETALTTAEDIPVNA
jgi:aspartate 1-decarboxylase